MISEFVCPCYGRIVYPDAGEPSQVMLGYGKNYDGYCTGEYVSRQLEDFHVTFLKIDGGDLSLSIFDNSSNYHKIATDALNAKKLNVKDRENNTPILRDGLYIDQNGHRVFHTMLPTEVFQKGSKTIILDNSLWINGMNKYDALSLLLQ